METTDLTSATKHNDVYWTAAVSLKVLDRTRMYECWSFLPPRTAAGQCSVFH